MIYNYINWITYLIQMQPGNNFFYIFCINKNIQNELKKIKSNNFKTFLFTTYKKKYIEKSINKIEENINCSLLEAKKVFMLMTKFLNLKILKITKLIKIL